MSVPNLVALVTWVAASVPVDPDSPEAKRLLQDELAKPEYQAAQPTWFDTLSAAVFEWLRSLQFAGVEGPPGVALLVVLVAVVIGLVVLFLIFGLPRLNRRSRITGSLFGENDARDAAAMRRDAEAAARAGDHTLATAEMFRAIARGLAERTVVTTMPGTTAHEFAVRAGGAFPAYSDALALASASFDNVRYLGGSASADVYDQVARLESDLRVAKPILEQVPL
ncbi:MAG: DUF4129 domain-containing protein [Microbacteriaceae bacterium]